MVEIDESLDVAIIGAGFSGIGAAIRLLKQGKTNFRVFDKAGGVAGGQRVDGFVN